MDIFAFDPTVRRELPPPRLLMFSPAFLRWQFLDNPRT